MTEEVKLVHRPERPSWICEVDFEEWPCPDAKRELRRVFAGRGIAFGSYLAARLGEAANDLLDVPEDDLLRRFVLWPGREHESGWMTL